MKERESKGRGEGRVQVTYFLEGRGTSAGPGPQAPVRREEGL
jgi:hypothetical protein